MLLEQCETLTPAVVFYPVFIP